MRTWTREQLIDALEMVFDLPNKSALERVYLRNYLNHVYDHFDDQERFSDGDDRVSD